MIDISYLKYGSLITLSTKEKYFLYSHGFIQTSPYLQESSSKFFDLTGALFQVVPPCMYSVQTSLNEYMNGIREVDYGEKINQLVKIEESLEGEIKTNIHTYNLCKGQEILYDSFVQLEHIKSHKFLTLHSQISAETEKDNFKLTFEDFPSEYSHFRVVPSYKYQNHGSRKVKFSDKVYLQIVVPELRKTAWMHESKALNEIYEANQSYTESFILGSRTIEVNISLDKKTRWVLGMYTNTLHDEKTLCCGNHVWLHIPEENANLSLFKENWKDEKENLVFGKTLQDTNGLWMIEYEDIFIGGPVEEEKFYRLKHIATNKYLGVKKRPYLTPKRNFRTLWKFVSIGSKGFVKGDELCYLINKENNVTIKYFGDGELKAATELDEHCIYKPSKADSKVIWETLFLLHCHPILANFPIRFSNLVEFNESKIKYFEFHKYCDSILKCIKSLQQFVENRLGSMIGVDTHFGEVQKNRQIMLKQQNFFEVLINILDSESIENNYEHLKEMCLKKQKYRLSKSESDLETVKLKNISTILNEVYILLISICNNNTENQKKAYEFRKVFLKHIGLKLGATKLLLQILGNNEDLILGLSEESENMVKVVCFKLKEFSEFKKKDLIKFLKGICVFEGEAISINQEYVFANLLKKKKSFNSTLIQTEVVDSDLILKFRSQTIPLLSCFESGRIIGYEEDIKYYICLLKLYSNLSKGRNFESFSYFLDKFPFEILNLLIWNKNLNIPIRGAFCQLLNNLYIDCFLRDEVIQPGMIKLINYYNRANLFEMTSLNKKVLINDEDLYFEIYEKSQNGMRVLLKKIADYFEDSKSNKIETIFTYKILQVIFKILQFDVCKLILDHNDLDENSLNLIRIIEAVVPLLYYSQKGNIYIRLNTEQQRKNAKMNPKSSIENRASYVKYLSTISRDINNFTNPVIRSATNLKNFLNLYKRNPFNSLDKKDITHKIKLKICKILDHLLNSRQNYLLDNVIEWFCKAENTQLSPKNLEKLLPDIIILKCEKVSSKFNKKNFKIFKNPPFPTIESLCPGIIQRLILAFTENDNYKLQSMLLSLIFRSYQQRREMLKNIKDMHVLSRFQDISLYNWLKSTLRTFKHNSEQSEIWMNYWNYSPSLAAKNKEVFANMMEILKNLTFFFHDDVYIVDNELSESSSKTISKSRQEILYFLKVHSIIVNLIKDGIHKLATIYNENRQVELQEPCELLSRLFESCYRVLKRFVYDNFRNQKKLFRYIHVLMQHLHIPLGQIPLICEIFKNNSDLIGKITEDFVNVFRELIKKYGRQAEFLKVFEVIQVVKEKPNSSIQRLVLSMFAQEKPDYYMLYMTDKETPKFDFKALPPKNLFYNDQPIIYHSMLLMVLAKCGYGTSGMLLTEIKCQNIVSLNNIFDILMKCEDEESRYFKLKIPIVLFFYHIYIECDKLNSELKSYPKFLSYIRLQTQNIYSLEEFSSSFIEFFNVLVKIIVKYRESYIKKVYNDYLEQEDVVVIRHFCQAIACNWNRLFYILNKSKLDELIDICFFFDEKIDHHENQFEKIIEDERKLNDEKSFYSLRRTGSIFSHQTIKGVEIENWIEVRYVFVYNKEFKDCLKEEELALIHSLYFISKLENSCNFETVIKSLITYVRFSQSQSPPSKLLIMAIQLIERIITTPIAEKKEDLEKAKIAMQCKMSFYGLTNVILGLLMDEQLKSKVFNSLLSLSIALLEGGNYQIQQEFYQYFVTYSRSEFFFRRLSLIIRNKIENISAKVYTIHSPKPIIKERKGKVKTLLRFLQLLCENHNHFLQNYLRVQEKSYTNYNLIVEVVNLLDLLMQKKIFIHFPMISQCYETLTEFIQGPCLENQVEIINSNFIDIAGALLSINEYGETFSPFIGLELNTYNTFESISNSDLSENYYLDGWMIAHLKYKCLITIISLFEGRKDEIVSTRIVRSLNLQIFKENIKNLYFNHKSSHKAFSNSYKEFGYNYDIFNHISENENYDFDCESNPQDEKPNYYCLVIEIGFLIYHIIRTLQDGNDPENLETLNNDLKNFSGHNSAKLKLFKRKKTDRMRKKEIIVSIKKYKYCGPEHKESNKVIIAKSFEFFRKHTGNIEVIFNGEIFRIYFYYPPEYKGLTKHLKYNFHRKANRDSDQAKLKYLLDSVPEITEIIRHEFFLMNLTKKNRIAHFIASNVERFRISAFILTILLNLTNLTSYKHDRSIRSAYTITPDDDGLGEWATEVWMNFLGFLQLGFCILIVMFFLAKAGPILAKKGWDQTNFITVRLMSSKYRIAHVIVKLVQIFNTLYYVLSDFDVIFYMLYALFSVLGTFSHPIYFSLLLLDVVYRYPSLQNVVNSIYLPRKALILTFALMIVIVYLFTIFSYFMFEDYFSPNCKGLLQCFMVLWDQSFKNSGGIGGFLDYPNTPSFDPARFFFDNIYNILVMIVLLGVVQGIITDTFARLREGQDFCTKDMENKCFICGLQRDFIEKNTVEGFLNHIESDHNEWNYILFIIYLLGKEETEYSGIESYVREQYDKDDLAWIPNKVSLSINDPKTMLFNKSMKVFDEKLQELEFDLNKIKTK